MYNSELKKKWLSIILIVCILFPMTLSGNSVKAESLPFEIVKNGENNGATYNVMFTADAATTTIRFETVGFHFTTSSISNTIPSDAAKMMFGQYGSEKRGDSIYGNIVKTSVFFTAQSVIDAYKSIGKTNVEGRIYVHAIFRTYNMVNGEKIYLHNGRTFSTYNEIVNAESWSQSAIDNFSRYFNMDLDIVLTKEKKYDLVTIRYITEDNIKLQDNFSFGECEVGKEVSWNDEIDSIDSNATGIKKTYKLVAYKIYNRKDTQKILEYKSIDAGASLDSIRNGSYIVPEGGLFINMIYRDEGAPPPPPPTPPPSDPDTRPLIIPEVETVFQSMNFPMATGYIGADNRGNERFAVTQGIPTTESLFTQVNTTKYLLGYNLTKQVGVETYPVQVTKDYILQWKVKDATGEKVMTETVTVEQIITIQRAYGYWEIMNFDLYGIGYATINNYALPGGLTTMTVTNYSLPNVSINHSSSKDLHLILPTEITNGVKLPAETLTGNIEKPAIPTENFTSEADLMIPDLMVRNDGLTMNGSVILDASPSKLEGPRVNDSILINLQSNGMEMCNNNVLYQSGQVIGSTKKNGTYSSWGTVIYTRSESVNSVYDSRIAGNIPNVNDVVIHTPVYCQPVVDANNDKYVQLIHPSSAIQLVLDPNKALNNFTIKISNTGYHSNKSGYTTRDFSRSLRNSDISYIAETNGVLRNEVKFPFDVYISENNNDKFIKKNTWVILGRNTVSFHLPMWVKEGMYSVDCRTIAVNADRASLDQISETRVNTNLHNYVATNTFQIEVSGRIYGLSIYDITDYPMWEEVFRVKDSLNLKIHNLSKYPDGTDQTTYSKNYSYNYTVGINDQYGNTTGRKEKYTFPLINNSHPRYKNIGILKTGYAVRFTLDTIGTMYSDGSSVHIKPTFYYVDNKGNNRIAVDLYYEESMDGKNRKLVKVGSNFDKNNVKTMEVGSPYVGIPVQEMKDTASILGMKYSDFIYNRVNIFTFYEIWIPPAFRTFTNMNYTKSIVSSDQYPNIQASGISQGFIMQQMQSWYGCYYIPSNVHAVPKGFNVNDYALKYGIRFTEDFWKTDGYIIVNLDIVTIDNSGQERLSYINSLNYKNNNNMSMWITEGAPYSKTDYSGEKFHFKAGDFILYYTDKSVGEDYSPGGIY